jgi:hypothetical protein
LLKEEISILYPLSSIFITIKSRRMRWAGHLEGMAKTEGMRMLAVGPGGRRSLERDRRSWLDNIKMDVGEVGWGSVNLVGLAQDR